LETEKRTSVGCITREIFLNKSPKDDMQAQAEAKFKRKEQQARDGVKAMAEYVAAGDAMRAKTEKLRALRLAKEAADKHAAEEAEARKPQAAAKKKRT
jgi:hypothetical protein